MLDELAEMSRALARSLRERQAGAANARDAGRMARLADDIERGAVRALALKALIEARRRRRAFGLAGLRRARPPTPTHH
ncbi:hypothetical protein [Phenylobacterium sp.]|uniref:hypothetical protein n=1 Tax=Phenylobacterium sp. TaxID=1871053 RepID=UPI00286BDC59|nr:hypothetical protein [Phenylobacterium sp.]